MSDINLKRLLNLVLYYPGHPDIEKLMAHFDKQSARVAELELKVERYEDALQELADWARAYPLDIFPEPDFKKANAILNANGMTVDAISASAMRHLLVRVQEIVMKARSEDENRHCR